MQNPIFKFIQSSIISKEPGHLSKKLKILLRSSSTEFTDNLHTFPTQQYLEKSVRDFFILFRSGVMLNLVSVSIQKQGFSLILANKSRHIQNKTNPEHLFLDIGKYETCAKFQLNLLNSMVVGALQSFQFFRQNTQFLENSTVLAKFLYWILHYVIAIAKLKKSVHKIQFYTNHASPVIGALSGLR